MSALSRASDRLDLVRRRVLRHRRPLAALAAGAAVYVAVQAATAPPPATIPVWTAARDLPSGTVLSAGDLVQRSFTPESVPADHLQDPARVLGRTTATPLGRGVPVTTSQVVGDDWLTRRPGLSAVPVRLTDPSVVPLLRTGDRITLLAADPQHPGDSAVLTSAATVLAVPGARTRADGALPGRLVLVGVPPEQADSVATASATRFLTVIWSR